MGCKLFNVGRLRSFMPMLVLALLSGAAYGQETASIVGTVSDPTGGAVPGVKISVTNTDTGLTRSTTTNTTGSYAAHELPIGHYAVRAEAAGFKAFERTFRSRLENRGRASVSRPTRYRFSRRPMKSARRLPRQK